MAKLNRQTTKTTTILCAAAGLIAAAVILGVRHDAGAKNPNPVLIPKGGPMQALTCGDEAPSSAGTVFSAGTLNASLSGSKLLQGSDGEMYLAVDIEARDAAAEGRPPLDVAIVIDRSGSMHGEKLARARDAARGLVDRLGPSDRAALVQFDDAAQILVPSTVTDANGRAQLIAAIDSIGDGGGTNIHGAMVLGRDQLLSVLSKGRLNRVILMSDGNANAGITDVRSLARIAGDAAEQGVRITTVGLGLDYNEDLMEAIAENGRGQYYYVREASELQAVFDGELRSMQATVATNAELRLEPACAGVEIVEVYGYATRREGSAVIVQLADLVGGDKRKVVARLRVPAHASGKAGVLTASFAFDPAGGGSRQLATSRLGVEVVNDALAVDRAADTAVIAKVAQVESGLAMREAAEAYGRGDVARAKSVIARQRKSVADKAARYQLAPEAAAPAAAPLDKMETEMDANDFRSSGGAHTKKGNKADAYKLMH